MSKAEHLPDAIPTANRVYGDPSSGSGQVTGVDLNAGMLEHARRLNPEATYIQGDMRTVRLETSFDAVITHTAPANATGGCRCRRRH